MSTTLMFISSLLFYINAVIQFVHSTWNVGMIPLEQMGASAKTLY